MARYRLSFEPLVRLVVRDDRAPSPVDGATKADSYLAERFGVQRRTVQRWHERGVDVWWADKLATRVGLVPELIWGDEYSDAIDAECMAKLGCPDCGQWLCFCAVPLEAAPEPDAVQLQLQLEAAS